MSLHHTLTGTAPATNGDRLIPAEHRVPAGWVPSDRTTGRAVVPADATAVLCLPPDIDLAEVTPR